MGNNPTESTTELSVQLAGSLEVPGKSLITQLLLTADVILERGPRIL